MQQEKLEILYNAYLNGTATAEERALLLEYVSDETYHEQVKALMDTYYDSSVTFRKHPDHLASAMFQAIVSEHPVEKKENPLRHLHYFKSRWLRYAAAILLVAGAILYFQSGNHKVPQPVTDSNPTEQPNTLLSHLTPPGDKAILTLSDGSTIMLDSAANGTLARQGDMTVVKLSDGKISYQPAANPNITTNQVVLLNTMSTPRGGKYQLTLPDGSRVWLNAISSITYPTTFSEEERSVKITGEVYFEVAKDKKRPFIVRTRTDAVTVLGTQFNVNAYDDEMSVKTSLVEGSVKIRNAILKPGQAYLDGRIVVTNIEQDIAWKNGLFNFHKLSLEVVLRQIARWYDISLEYENGIPDIVVGGEMQRSLTLEEVLKGLSVMQVKYRLEGNRLIILNNK